MAKNQPAEEPAAVDTSEAFNETDFNVRRALLVDLIKNNLDLAISGDNLPDSFRKTCLRMVTLSVRELSKMFSTR